MCHAKATVAPEGWRGEITEARCPDWWVFRDLTRIAGVQNQTRAAFAHALEELKEDGPFAPFARGSALAKGAPARNALRSHNPYYCQGSSKTGHLRSLLAVQPWSSVFR